MATVEVLTGPERRRRWSIEEKLRLVAEAERPGMSVSLVASRHGVSRSLLFQWRRQVLAGALASPAPAAFVPVHVVGDSASPDAAAVAGRDEGPAAPAVRQRDAHGGTMEIQLRNGRRVRVDASVDAAALKRVLDVLDER